MFELLTISLVLVSGAVAATYAYSAWGTWGGVVGFVIGSLSFAGARKLILMAMLTMRPRCICGRLMAAIVREEDVDGQPLRVCDCGRMYCRGDDQELHLLPRAPEGDSEETPRG